MKSWLVHLMLLVSVGITLTVHGAPSINSVDDLLNLDPKNVRVASVSAVVVEMESAVPLYWKNADIVVPIASITKLMSAMVLLDGKQPLDEELVISREGFHSRKSSYSRIRPGSRISRGELLRLSLMSS
jgi:serine-type D-Ala-D-Ala endopeptidase (penicillin-binding protein 7)